MIAWLNPSAVFALAAAAVPLVIHLLLRQRARRIVVPSVRFIRQGDESSLRMRTPSDLLLLAVRTAIVALAAIAVLQPLALSSGRKATWAGRIVRAIVVDTSDSVDADAADIAARAEARDAFAARRFDAADPGAALAKAADWLNAAGPARKELVVLSDFQLGTVTAAQIDQVPSSVGIRPVRIAQRSSDVALDAGRVLHRDLALDVHVELSGADTRVSLTSSSPDPEGLRIVTSEQRTDTATSLMSAVRNAGVLAPSRDQPVVVSFRGSPEEQRDETFSPWVRAAALRLLMAPSVRELEPRVLQRDGALVVAVDTDVNSWPAAALLHAVLNSRRDEGDWTEKEPLAVPDPELRAWTRQPAPPDADAWRQGDESDGRWCWLGSLLLLGVEVFIRRAKQAPTTVESARAA